MNMLIITVLGSIRKFYRILIRHGKDNKEKKTYLGDIRTKQPYNKF
jgi:hypothetical protein